MNPFDAKIEVACYKATKEKLPALAEAFGVRTQADAVRECIKRCHKRYVEEEMSDV